MDQELSSGQLRKIKSKDNIGQEYGGICTEKNIQKQHKYTETTQIPEDGGDGITQSPIERLLTAEPNACTSPTPS